MYVSIIRPIITSKGLPLHHTKLMILLVDQQMFLNCSDISTSRNNMSIIVFGLHSVHVIPEVHTHVVTDLNSAVKGVINYYK